MKKQFMATYIGDADSPAVKEWDALPAAEQKKKTEEGMQAWMDWGKKHMSRIKVMGGPVGKTKRTDAKGVSDVRNNISGYIVIEADSHEEAAKLFLNHPHFTIFPGDAVEIMECMPLPEMPK